MLSNFFGKKSGLFSKRFSTISGYSTAKIDWSNPGIYSSILEDDYERRINHYNFMWAAFTNEIFTENKIWSRYLKNRNLYKKTVPLFNPTQRLVKFYAANVYPGRLSYDGKPLPNDVPLAIPISDRASDELKLAIAQTWQWSNWEQHRSIWITYCAALGDGPLEIVDDVEKGKVSCLPLWPGYITAVDFDTNGNVISYTKEVGIPHPDTGRDATFKKEVNKETITTYLDGEEYSYYNTPAVRENPYGFVPLVWCQHEKRGIGYLPGTPALTNWNKIEELNSMVSQLNAYIRKQAISPQLLSGVGTVSPYSTKIDGKEIDPDELLLLVSTEPGVVQTLQGNLQIEAAQEQIRMLLEEIQADLPEIVAFDLLRNMSQVTGPAARRLLGDVVGILRSRTAGYDAASISAFQMMVSIGGWRLKNRDGGWKNPTNQQLKFAGYDLDSFKRGDLDFTIDDRELVVDTDLERYLATLTRGQAMQAMREAGIPVDYQLHKEGTEDDEINVIHLYRENEATEKRILEVASLPPQGLLTEPEAHVIGVDQKLEIFDPNELSKTDEVDEEDIVGKIPLITEEIRKNNNKDK